MRTLIAIIATLFTLSARAWAGDDGNSIQGEFYCFTAPIVSSPYQVVNPAYSGVVIPPGKFPPPNYLINKESGNTTGFGGELLGIGQDKLGASVELGYAAADWNFNGNYGVGLGSADASYHIFDTRSRRRIDPFAMGGYSLYFGERTAFQSGYNFGGGVNLWFIKHVAARLEVREQAGIHYFGNAPFTHYLGFRFGLTFR